MSILKDIEFGRGISCPVPEHDDGQVARVSDAVRGYWFACRQPGAYRIMEPEFHIAKLTSFIHRLEAEAEQRILQEHGRQLASLLKVKQEVKPLLNRIRKLQKKNEARLNG